MDDDELSRAVAVAMGWRVSRPNGYFYFCDRDNTDEITQGFVSEAEAWQYIIDKYPYATDATAILAAVREKGFDMASGYAGSSYGGARLVDRNPPFLHYCAIDNHPTHAFERALCKALLAAGKEGETK